MKATDTKNKTINEEKASNTAIDDESATEQLSHFGVAFFNVSAKWTTSQANNTLENINFITKPNRLVAIVGPVGAGKVSITKYITINLIQRLYYIHKIFFSQSSLLQAILQELPLIKGNISVRGVVSYASQEPWIFAGSVKQNILLGSPMDKTRYDKVNSL